MILKVLRKKYSMVDFYSEEKQEPMLKMPCPTISSYAMQRLDELQREVKELKRQVEDLRNNDRVFN